MKIKYEIPFLNYGITNDGFIDVPKGVWMFYWNGCPAETYSPETTLAQVKQEVAAKAVKELTDLKKVHEVALDKINKILNKADTEGDWLDNWRVQQRD
jgi:hypothetical protein